MRADAQRHAPFKEHFQMSVLRTFKRYEAAENFEAHLIAHNGTQDASKGYNTLPSTPGKSQVFWMQHRRRQRQAQQ
jgi:hypothetical protein